MKKKFLNLLIAATVAGSLICSALPAFAAENSADGAKSATIRLEKTEGTVALQNGSGNKLPTRKDMKLSSGYELSTELKSYAYINLDNSKAVKLDESSAASVRKSGKKLELLLDYGKVFFNVSKPLKVDETLEIRASNMVTGIRGTSAEISCIGSDKTIINLFDGHITVSTTDAKTGEARNITINPGDKATITKIAAPSGAAGADVVLEKMTEDDISGFAAKEIAKNPELQDRIAKSTDLDVEKVAKTADEKLKKDQAVNQEKKQEIEEAVKEKEKEKEKAVKPPVTAAPPETTAPTTPPVDPPVTPPLSGSVTLSGNDLTLQKFTEALEKYKDITLDVPNSDTATFNLTSSLIVAPEQSVTIPQGTLALTGQGALNSYGKLVINGAVTIAGCALNNYGAISVTRQNRVITSPLIKTEAGGTFTMVEGSLDSKAYPAAVNYGIFNMDGGRITSSNDITAAQNNTGSSTFVMTGGMIENTSSSSVGTAAISSHGAPVTVKGGTIKGRTAIRSSSGGTLNISQDNDSTTLIEGTTTGIAATGGSGTVTITGGTIKGDTAIDASDPLTISQDNNSTTLIEGITKGIYLSQTPANCTITGGTVKGDIAIDSVGTLTVSQVNDSTTLIEGTTVGIASTGSAATCTINGGTITGDTAISNTGELIVSQSSGSSPTIAGVATGITSGGDYGSCTIEGGTIQGAIAVNNTKTLTVEQTGGSTTLIKGILSGISSTGSAATCKVTDGTVEATGEDGTAVSVSDGATCTIEGGTIQGGGNGILNNISILNVTDGTIKGDYAIRNNGTLTVSGSAALIEGITVGIASDGGASTCTLTDGTVKATGNSGIGINLSNDSTCTIAGGTVTSKYKGISNVESSSTLEISGGIVECTFAGGSSGSEFAIDGVFTYTGTSSIRARAANQVCRNDNVPSGYHVGAVADNWFALLHD